MLTLQEFKQNYQKIEVLEYPNKVPKNVTVSICVQTYQHANYIAECLDSLLCQKTSFPFEILLGEDASTDGTREICIEYAKKHPDKIRLFLHHRENNIKLGGKPSGRFNLLNNIFQSQGKYLSLCEGDDYWSNEAKLQTQVDFLEENKNYNVIGHNIETLHENGEITTSRYFTFNDGRHYLYQNFTPTLSLLYRKPQRNITELPGYLRETPMADFPLSYFMSKSAPVKKLREPMGVRRIHNEGTWSQLSQIRVLEIGIEAREIMRPEIKQDDLPFLNGGINRLEVKKYLTQKAVGKATEAPNLIKDAKFFKKHQLIMRLATALPNKKAITLLNKLC